MSGFLRLLVPLTILSLYAGFQVSAQDYRQSLVLHNELASCVTVTTGAIAVKDNIVSVRADFRPHKPIGACGCVSALAVYDSSVDVEGAGQIVQEGIVNTRKAGGKTLILATEPGLVAGRKIALRLTCSRPL